jgi:hypothetical protein
VVFLLTALALLLILSVSIGDLVGATVFGLVVAVLGWVYWKDRREKSTK